MASLQLQKVMWTLSSARLCIWSRTQCSCHWHNKLHGPCSCATLINWGIKVLLVTFIRICQKNWRYTSCLINFRGKTFAMRTYFFQFYRLVPACTNDIEFSVAMIRLARFACNQQSTKSDLQFRCSSLFAWFLFLEQRWSWRARKVIRNTVGFALSEFWIQSITTNLFSYLCVSVYNTCMYKFTQSKGHDFCHWTNLSQKSTSFLQARNQTMDIRDAAKEENLDVRVFELIKAAHKTRQLAYCPYSNFHVGAAVLCEDGTIVTGTGPVFLSKSSSLWFVSLLQPWSRGNPVPNGIACNFHFSCISFLQSSKQENRSTRLYSLWPPHVSKTMSDLTNPTHCDVRGLITRRMISCVSKICENIKKKVPFLDANRKQWLDPVPFCAASVQMVANSGCHWKLVPGRKHHNSQGVPFWAADLSDTPAFVILLPFRCQCWKCQLRPDSLCRKGSHHECNQSRENKVQSHFHLQVGNIAQHMHDGSTQNLSYLVTKSCTGCEPELILGKQWSR